MRSSTTFLIFGGILAALILLAAFSRTTSDPVTRTTKAFLTAVAQHDANAIEKLVDPANCKIIRAGDRFGGVNFAETTPAAGAFLKKPAVMWSSIELTPLEIDTSVDSVFDNEHGLASVPMKGGVKFYLHRVSTQAGDKNGNWLIYYIAKPEAAKE